MVLLQETTPGWEDALRATFAQHDPHMRFHHCCGAGGLAVLSRHPIARDEVVPAVSWFPAWRGVVQTPLGPVQFLSVPKTLALTAAAVLEEGPSDHFPILARFESAAHRH